MGHSSDLAREGVPDRRGYLAHVVSNEERSSCHHVLPGQFLSLFRSTVGADFFLDPKNLRTGRIRLFFPYLVRLTTRWIM